MKSSREDITVIIEKNKNLIFKVVNAYCYYPEEQENLIQEIIIHLLKSYKRFDYGVQITTWIYKIAFNVVISYNRKIKTREKYFVPLKEKFVHIQDENKVEDDENLKKLNHFIAQLKPLHKALMIMYLDQKSHKEIAMVLGISESNVGTKINRIKKELKTKFKK
ncbi:sigma-70 family RNA polymerase sigma factor [Zunongwangia profunda]|uniref:RNA polymerase sigma factor n=1 Tax=Zunongwangia profunda TaxID=398743 RepID=UPI000C9082AC|nr:RNA polymerase subunit sigma-70 [Flavobacteriaceae bacterium]|tara:strand:+ start:427 stop:918 length:492 start_codon:yes stop_codon:yes gene_type:complete